MTQNSQRFFLRRFGFAFSKICGHRGRKTWQAPKGKGQRERHAKGWGLFGFLSLVLYWGQEMHKAWVKLTDTESKLGLDQ